MRPPCTNHLVAGDVLLETCGACGHILLLHPGPASPAKAACIACIMWAPLEVSEPKHKR